MVAAEQGNLEIAQELIRRGANVNLDDVVSAHAHSRTQPLKWPDMDTPPTHTLRYMCLAAQVSTGTGEKTVRPFKPHHPCDGNDLAELVALMFRLAEVATLSLSPHLL